MFRSLRKIFALSVLAVILSFMINCGVKLIDQKTHYPKDLTETFLPTDTIVVSPNELKSLLPNAKRGTVFLIKNGTYDNVEVSISKNNDKPVIIKPQEEGKVVFTGSSFIRIWKTQRLALSGFYFKNLRSKKTPLTLNNCKEVEISENYFEDCGSSAVGTIIRIENQSKQNNIVHNTLYKNRAIGIAIAANPDYKEQCVNNYIHHNLFFRIPRVRDIYPDQSNGLEAIQLGQGAEDAEIKLYTHVYENLFEEIIGDGSEILSIKTSNNYIYNNTFRNNRSGITARYGNKSEIRNNYLENTDQGIRIFGYGHTVRDNYIVGGRVGIQLPAAHYKKNERVSTSGYFQQENVKVFNNLIIDPTSAAIFIGNNRSPSTHRTLMPRNISIKDNTIALSATDATQYQIEDADAVRELRMSRNRHLLNADSIKNIRQNRLLQLVQYTRFDSGIGATWKTPN